MNHLLYQVDSNKETHDREIRAKHNELTISNLLASKLEVSTKVQHEMLFAAVIFCVL
jgi:hypothetical protein